MSETPAGAYHIERIFAQELLLQGIMDVAALPDAFKVEYAWDWEPRDHETFYVLLGMRGLPGKDRPERITVSMAALFRRVGNPVKPTLVDFVMTNGPTILIPYIRETVSNMTTRGTVGTYTLPPFNVVKFMSAIKFELSAGAKKLAARPDIIRAYEVMPEVIAQISDAPAALPITPAQTDEFVE